MKMTLAALCLGGALMVGGCGGDDDGGSSAADPVTACKNIVASLCSKFYGCFSEAELKIFPDVVGNNEADCRTKYEGESCNTEALKCDSGETYDSEKAGECVTQYEALSCAEFKSPSTATPAACEQTCR